MQTSVLLSIKPEFVETARHVLFDFDGTLSLIRAGLAGSDGADVRRDAASDRRGETEPSAAPRWLRDIMRLNGKQTIYQMMRLAERGPPTRRQPGEPLWLQAASTCGGSTSGSPTGVEGLRSGRIRPDDMLVHGAGSCWSGLPPRGVTLYLASGTDEPFVKEEAELLGVDPLLRPADLRGPDDYQNFSKQMVIERILRENADLGRAAAGLRRRLRGESRTSRAWADWPWPWPATRPAATAPARPLEAAAAARHRRRHGHSRLIAITAPLLDYLWNEVETG